MNDLVAIYFTLKKNKISLHLDTSMQSPKL